MAGDWRSTTVPATPEAGFEQGPLDFSPRDVYSYLTGETGAVRVVIERDDIPVHLDIISGPGRGQRANCIRVNFQHRCETQLRPIDAPPAPMNDDARIVLREDEAGASILVMWADLNGNGQVGVGEVADVHQINWTDPWTHITFGDSYTSGTGIQAAYRADSSATGDDCLRSSLAYGWQIQQIAIEGDVLAPTTSSSPDLVDFRYAPCSGAVVGSIAELSHRGAPVQTREAGVAPHIDPTVDLISPDSRWQRRAVRARPHPLRRQRP